MCDYVLKPKFVHLVGKICASLKSFLVLKINHVPSLTSSVVETSHIECQNITVTTGTEDQEQFVELQRGTTNSTGRPVPLPEMIWSGATNHESSEKIKETLQRKDLTGSAF